MSIPPQQNQPGPEQVALVQKLFISHSPAISGYLLAGMPDLNTVDDLLHSTFLRATEKAADFQEGTNFVAWACSIARYELLGLVRDRRRAPLVLGPEVLEKLCTEVPAVEVDERRVRALWECIERLAPRAKQAILLCYRDGLLPREIASRMAVTAESMRVVLSRARQTIRRCVERRMRADENR